MRPTQAKLGTYVSIDVQQLEARSERVIGGLNMRVELVTAPRRRRGTSRKTAKK